MSFAALSNSEFVSGYERYKPNNVWSGLKRLGTHEYVGQPLVGAVDRTTKGEMTLVKIRGSVARGGRFRLGKGAPPRIVF